MIKVYGATRSIKKKIYRIIVATTSLTKASKFLETTSAYIAVTGNKTELDIALSNPEVVYYCLERFGVKQEYVTKEQLNIV